MLDRSAAAPPDPWPTAYPEGYAVVDVETTGLGRDDRIVSAAVYRLDARGDVEDQWYSPVNPERDPGPVWIHGLTREALAGAPRFPEIADALAIRLEGRVLVAHNAVFDWSMISREYARADRRAPVEQRLCTIHLSKGVGLPLSDYKLATLAAHYGVVQRRAHHALDDARVLTEAFRPTLHLAAAVGMELPLHACLPLTAPPAPRTSPESGTGAGPWSPSAPGSDIGPGPEGQLFSSGPSGWRTWRPARKRPACPYPNPGRMESGGPLVQGMLVAFSGGTAIEREDLEDRATEAGLHVASSISRLTSLLVTNHPDAFTSKIHKARGVGTPTVGEEEFVRLLEAVSPAPGTLDPPPRPPGQD